MGCPFLKLCRGDVGSSWSQEDANLCGGYKGSTAEGILSWGCDCFSCRMVHGRWQMGRQRRSGIGERKSDVLVVSVVRIRSRRNSCCVRALATICPPQCAAAESGKWSCCWLAGNGVLFSQPAQQDIEFRTVQVAGTATDSTIRGC